MQHISAVLQEALAHLFILSDAQERPDNWRPEDHEVEQAERAVSEILERTDDD